MICVLDVCAHVSDGCTNVCHEVAGIRGSLRVGVSEGNLKLFLLTFSNKVLYLYL